MDGREWIFDEVYYFNDKAINEIYSKIKNLKSENENIRLERRKKLDKKLVNELKNEI